MSTLDRYLGEREEQTCREEKELQVETSPALEEIIGAYESWLDLRLEKNSVRGEYECAIDSISGMDYTSSDVLALTLRMGEYEQHESFFVSGIFLSALVNEGEEEEYTLVTEHLETHLKYLGVYNTKNLSIEGDVGVNAGRNMSDGNFIINGRSGDFLGARMSGGNITIQRNADRWAGAYMSGGNILVKEDAGAYAGRNNRGGHITIQGNAHMWAGNRMSDGTLTIEGDVGDLAGSRMKGGTIIIKGNAGRLAGIEMTGGILRVEGEIERLCEWTGGLIYEGGKLVRPGPEDGKLRPEGRFI